MHRPPLVRQHRVSDANDSASAPYNKLMTMRDTVCGKSGKRRMISVCVNKCVSPSACDSDHHKLLTDAGTTISIRRKTTPCRCFRMACRRSCKTEEFEHGRVKVMPARCAVDVARILDIPGMVCVRLPWSTACRPGQTQLWY